MWGLILKLLMRAFSWHPWMPDTLKLDLILSLFKCAVLCIEDLNLVCPQAQWLGMTRTLKKRFWLESHRSTLVVEGRTCRASMQEPHRHWIGSKVWGSIRRWGRLIMSVHPAWAHSASFQDSSWHDGITIHFVNIFLEIIYLTSLTPVFHTGSLKADSARESIPQGENVIRLQKTWCGASLSGSSFFDHQMAHFWT